MSEENNEVRGYRPATEPAPDLRALDRLVGEWEWSGDYVRGTSTYEWMEDGFFHLQRYDFETPDGRKVAAGLEIIGHERPFSSVPGEEIKARQQSNTGDTLVDYVYELEGDTLTIWGGEKGAPAYFEGEFSGDSGILSGRWH